MELDLYNITTSVSPKPQMNIMVNGKQILFLCDSGACRTTIKEPFPDCKKGDKTVAVRTASGRIEEAPLSTPVCFKDPHPVGRECQAEVLLFPQCPINLLGRDLMIKLRIGLKPNQQTGRMEITRYDEEGDAVYVIEGRGAPNLYYTLDLPDTSPLKTGTELLKQAVKLITEPEDKMLSSELHVTMWYLGHIPPSPSYEKRMHAATPNTITLTYLYSDGDSTCAVAVKLPDELKTLHRGQYLPHVSLTKDRCRQWKELGRLVNQGERAGDWRPKTSRSRLEESVSTGLVRMALNWTVTVTMGIHMTGYP